jgi:hypothetical protein
LVNATCAAGLPLPHQSGAVRHPHRGVIDKLVCKQRRLVSGMPTGKAFHGVSGRDVARRLFR